MPSVSLGETTGYSMGRGASSRFSMSNASVRERPNDVHGGHSGVKASVAIISMNVAKASFSQMPFHHFIVTRSPNHMWASSWAMTSVTFCSSGWVTVGGIGEEQHLAERDAAEVLHGLGDEVGDGGHVHLVARIVEAVVLGEEVDAEGADLEGEGCEVALARGVRDAQRDPAGVDGGRDVEGADDERHQIGGHHHGVGERGPRRGRRRAFAARPRRRWTAPSGPRVRPASRRRPPSGRARPSTGTPDGRASPRTAWWRSPAGGRPRR